VLKSYGESSSFGTQRIKKGKKVSKKVVERFNKRHSLKVKSMNEIEINPLIEVSIGQEKLKSKSERGKITEEIKPKKEGKQWKDLHLKRLDGSIWC
jgi:hypothetical protein